MKKLVCVVKRFLLRHFVLGVLLFVSAGVSGAYLYHWAGPIGPGYGVVPEWFAASVMVASGKGFVAPVYSPDSPLGAFLDQQRPSIEASDLAGVKTGVPWHFHRRYRWLFWVAGLTWRLFGISWENLKILCVIAFAATIGIVYGIFRLGMNRWWSALGALCYMVSPMMVAALPSIRDFCKAPFILGSVLIVGYLIKYGTDERKTRKHFYLLAAGLGLLVGFGMGFRDDIQICLAPALAALVFGVGRSAAIRWRQRGQAALLLLVCFIIPAAPILKSMYDIGSLSYHHLIVGLATESNQYLGMGDASYERMALRSDNLAHALRNSYWRRVVDPNESLGFEDPGSAKSGKRFLWETFKVFPADFLARAYAAVLYQLGDVPVPLIVTPGPDDPLKNKLIAWERPVAEHFQRFGVYYAVVAFLLISLYSFRLAMAALLLVLYFCGYTSLQFHPRHGFHLAFVPFWFLFFLADKAVLAVWRLARSESRHRIFSIAVNSRLWRAPVARLGCFVAIAVVGLAAPLYLARAYQVHAVEKNIVRKCEAAQLAPIETAARPENGSWTVFGLKKPLPELPFIEKATDAQQWNVHTEYLVAEFAAGAPVRQMRMLYDAKNPAADFSATVDISPAGSSPGIARYFFPVYEFPAYAFVGQSRFVGMAFPTDQVAQFKGLYRVTNLESFGLLPHVSMPTDMARFRYFQTVRP